MQRKPFSKSTTSFRLLPSHFCLLIFVFSFLISDFRLLAPAFLVPPGAYSLLPTPFRLLNSELAVLPLVPSYQMPRHRLQREVP